MHGRRGYGSKSILMLGACAVFRGTPFPNPVFKSVALPGFWRQLISALEDGGASHRSDWNHFDTFHIKGVEGSTFHPGFGLYAVF